MTDKTISLSFEEFKKQGEALYGKDIKDWKYKCVKCGHIQSFNSIKQNWEKQNNTTAKEKILEKIGDMVHFSCEGRINNNIGCDWSLGGFLQIHKKTVINGDEKHRVFMFANEV
jgi:DNA-directed RNA polymerase subunit M/transcription elongation factor TFIIS